MKEQDVKVKIVNDDEAGSKKRGRKTTAEITAKLSSNDPAAIEAELALDRRLADVDAKFGDGQPYEKTRVEVEIRTHLSNSADSYLKAGYRLVQLKAHEGHGNFLNSLERINLGEDVAEKMMLTARKLQGTKLANSDSDRNLLPSKLYEIALLDDDQIDDLDKGGSVGTVTLDEIQRMTTREVREALRKERELRKAESELREKLLLQKEQKINDLERELHLRPKPTQEMMNEARLKQLARSFIAGCVDLQTAMREMRELLDEAARLPGVENVRLQKFSEELITYGTEGVIADWEVLTNEVVNLMPKAELPHVPRLG